MGGFALEGVRVLDFTLNWVGPGATMQLADMGAEVIKIETRKRPDYTRRQGPYLNNEVNLERSLYYLGLNRGKKGITLDLTQPRAIELVKKLAMISDVVAENFTPRVMEKLGIPYPVLREVNPDLVMLSLSGYGATGPDRDYVAYGDTQAAFSGLAHLTGYPGGPPMGVGTPVCDQTGGLFAAFCVMAALWHRAQTGEGQHIDSSMAEALPLFLPEAIMDYTLNKRVRGAVGNRDDVMAPHGCYRCRGEDKWVAIAVESDGEWVSLCNAAGHPEWANDERFRDGFQRLRNQDQLDALIQQWTLGREAMEVMETLQAAGVAAAPVFNCEELFNSPHLRSRGFFVEVEHPEIGKGEIAGTFAKLSSTPGGVRHAGPLILGEHNEYVFRELLGLSEEEIGTLEKEGVIA